MSQNQQDIDFLTRWAHNVTKGLVRNSFKHRRNGMVPFPCNRLIQQVNKTYSYYSRMIDSQDGWVSAGEDISFTFKGVGIFIITKGEEVKFTLSRKFFIMLINYRCIELWNKIQHESLSLPVTDDVNFQHESIIN